MSAKQSLEPWEVCFQKYRGSELAELVLLHCRLLLKNGHTTAEDAHGVPVTNPNIRGAAFKSLRRLGVAERGEITTGTTTQSHGHTMFVWKLKDGALARRILSRVSHAVMPACAPSVDFQVDRNGHGLLPL